MVLYHHCVTVRIKNIFYFLFFPLKKRVLLLTSSSETVLLFPALRPPHPLTLFLIFRRMLTAYSKKTGFRVQSCPTSRTCSIAERQKMKRGYADALAMRVLADLCLNVERTRAQDDEENPTKDAFSLPPPRGDERHQQHTLQSDDKCTRISSSQSCSDGGDAHTRALNPNIAILTRRGPDTHETCASGVFVGTPLDREAGQDRDGGVMSAGDMLSLSGPSSWSDKMSARAEEGRLEFFRTEYRAVEGEVVGLQVQW